ncbi:ATP-binding protein [Shewanella surugensis]|uniref:ATP-binding protein n=1 Tax=Shewanella surugensis TaxID=212020 RepID=A0ABT0LCX9_9GAMM|nr:ATP-binding protein [Shewanella surugensis]MCL1125566.1 ATP-binding protein [Shewanella surugensis]
MTPPESILLPSQEALLLRLQHISLYGEQLILLIGEQGAGKTTMINALLNELDEHSLALVTCPKHCDSDEIRRKVLIQLLKDPVFDDELALPDSLQQAADTLPRAICIVIDDADFLPYEIWAECLALSQLSLAETSIRVICTTADQFLPSLLAQLSSIQTELLLPISIDPLSLEERQSLYDALLLRSEQAPFIVQDIVLSKLSSQKGTPQEVVSQLELALTDNGSLVPKRKSISKMKWTGVFLFLATFVGAMVFLLMPKSSLVVKTNEISQVIEVQNDTFVGAEEKAQQSEALMRKRERLVVQVTGSRSKESDIVSTTGNTIAQMPIVIAKEEPLGLDASVILQAGEAGLKATEIEAYSIAPSIGFSQQVASQKPVLLNQTEVNREASKRDETQVSASTIQVDAKDNVLQTPTSFSTKVLLGVLENTAVESKKQQSSIVWPILVSVMPTQGYTLQLANVTKIETLYRILTKVKDVEGLSVAQYKQGWLVLVGQFGEKEFANKKSLYLIDKYYINKPWVRRWTDLNEYELQVSVPSREIQ